MFRVIAVAVLVTGALAALVAQSPPSSPAWTLQSSGVTSRLRGVSAVDDRIAWASGAGGTVLRTVDGGASWQRVHVPGAEKLDFRDIDAMDGRVAYVLSIGNGPASRVYKTVDGGEHWDEQFVNDDPKAFYDAMAFWTEARGILMGDSIDGQFVIRATHDGGRTWARVPPGALPPALPNEGAFAASGTNVAVEGRLAVWIGTGAASAARVLRSADGGRTWAVAATPLPAGPSAGIFSTAFRDGGHGFVVGGDYRKEDEAVDNAARTDDGGVTWTAVRGLSGFRSAVAYVPGTATPSLVAVGPGGSDFSADDGRTWTRVEGPGFHALSMAPSGRVGWGVGEQGRIGRLTMGS